MCTYKLAAHPKQRPVQHDVQDQTVHYRMVTEQDTSRHVITPTNTSCALCNQQHLKMQLHFVQFNNFCHHFLINVISQFFYRYTAGPRLQVFMLTDIPF